MPQIIKTPTTKVVSKNGECEITVNVEPIVIEITLNVNSDGVVNIASAKQTETITKKEEEPTKWAIPSFSTNKIQFGK